MGFRVLGFWGVRVYFGRGCQSTAAIPGMARTVATTFLGFGFRVEGLGTFGRVTMYGEEPLLHFDLSPSILAITPVEDEGQPLHPPHVS